MKPFILNSIIILKIVNPTEIPLKMIIIGVINDKQKIIPKIHIIKLYFKL